MSAVGGRNSKMSPALVGSITVLIIVITTFLAYNANRGLPWVPSLKLTVEVKNAANIVPGNEVRIGGTRVGVVEAQELKRYPDGTITALIDLKLDQGTEPLPDDTKVLIRARSLLGLKYIQLTPGDSNEVFDWGSRVPLANATPDPVEIDQLLNTFDEPTRMGIVSTITAFGNALVGRGSVIGQLIDDAAPLSDRLIPVVKVLSDEDEGIVPFLTALSRFTGELAAAGEATGGLFRGLDRTLGGLAAADQSLDETLVAAPDALSSTADSLAGTRAAVGPHITFARTLQPSFENIANGSSDLASATEAGVTGLAGVPRFARDFSAVLDQLDRIGNSSVVARGLDGVTQFSKSSQPLVESLSRAQRGCSYLSLLFRNLGGATSDGDAIGNWLRAAPYLPAYIPNGEGGPATGPAQGTTPPAGAFAVGTSKDRQVAIARTASLFTNPRPVTGAGGVCQPGYEVREFPGAGTQNVTIGATGVRTPVFRPAPPKGSPFRPTSLDAEEEE